MTTPGDAVRVLVFAKAPRAGEVKTRLIPLLGAEGAAALHAQLIERTLALATEAAIGRVELYGTSSEDAFLRETAARRGVRLIKQSAGNLGTRMCSAFERALSAAPAAILIGTDCPALETRHLKDAAAALMTGNDAVFVPAEDGGYALIGLRRAAAELFEGVEWSTEHVMSQTRQRLRDSTCRWLELETLWDVDRPADYERLMASGLDFGGNSPGTLASYIR